MVPVRVLELATRIEVVIMLRLVRETRLVVMNVGLVSLLVMTVTLAGLVLSLTLMALCSRCPVLAIQTPFGLATMPIGL